MLTVAQHDIIRAELINDPLGIGYAGLNHDERAAKLNIKNRTVHRRISLKSILLWSAFTGGIGKLKTAVSSRLSSDPLHSVAEAALALLSSGEQTMDITPDVLDLLDVLVDGGKMQPMGVTGGVLTTSDRDAFLSRSAELVSRADELLGAPDIITAQDVYIALHERDPNFTPPPGQPFDLDVLQEMAQRSAAELSSLQANLAEKQQRGIAITADEAALLSDVERAATNFAGLLMSATPAPPA